MTAPVERRLAVGWGELGALAWARPGRPRALCLHGWMDNAASFGPLAAQLPGLDMVALDYAGHGRSDHRPAGCHYHFQDYVFDVDAALDALGWDSCLLIGHSLGTGVALSYACSDPARVTALLLLDGLGVMTEPPELLPARMVRSLRSVRNPRVHQRVYPSLAEAAAVRIANNPMLESSARLLAGRALEATTDGWRWRTDGRAMWTSPAYLTEAQSSALMGAVVCPGLALYTDTLQRYLGERLDIRLRAMPGLRATQVAGGHHVHMDDPASLAGDIMNFIDQLETPT